MAIYRNKLLADLPAHDLEALRPHLRPVHLALNQVLHEVGVPIDHVYFVENGLVSLTADTGDNGLVEVGMTGRDGLVGTPVLLNAQALAVHRTVVQIPGNGWSVRSATLRDLVSRMPGLRDRCLRSLHFAMIQVSQSAACNARHELPERLARWLLMARDQVDSDVVPMTQEFLSFMLGVRRAGVSAVTNVLQDQGLIRQARGHVILLDRAGLEAEACSCYGLIAAARKQVMQDGG